MAKPNNKNNGKKDLNNNFEALKAQMMKKRMMAEEAMDKTADTTDVIDEIGEEITAEQPNIVDEDYTEDYLDETVLQQNPYNNYTEPSYNNLPQGPNATYYQNQQEFNNGMPQNNISPRNDNFLTVEVKQPEAQVSMNKIIIKKIEKPEQPKRITYYLKPETIKKIDRYSRMAGMGKSEFVQNILDTVLNNLEIEK